MHRSHRKDRSTRLAVFLAVAIVLVLVTAIVLVSLTYHSMVLGGHWAMTSDWLRSADVETRSAALGQLGDYFGGTLNPILSFSGFLVLLLTVVLQRRQLKEGTRQLEQSTRAIDLEAFVRVHDILQAPEAIAARQRLYELSDSTVEHTPFTAWTSADLRQVYTVGSQFELVGLLVEGRLFDPDLFLRSWYRTVEKCWSACEAMVRDHRIQEKEPDFWQHFEQLHALARGCKPTASDSLGYEPAVPGDPASPAAQRIVQLAK